MASMKHTTVTYVREPANTSAWFGGPAAPQRPKRKFLTNSQKSVIDTDMDGGIDIPHTFRGTFKHIPTNSPRNQPSPRNVAHRGSPVQHHKAPTTSWPIMASPDPAFYDRPTAVGNKYPFTRPSGQVHNQQALVYSQPEQVYYQPEPVYYQPEQVYNQPEPVYYQQAQVSPRVAYGQRSMSMAARNPDRKEVRKPVASPTRSKQPAPEYRFIHTEHDPNQYQVVDNRAQTRMMVYQDDPMVRYA